MGSLLVVTGPPGAGKSTVSSRLASGLSHSVLVEGDQFFSFLAGAAIEPWSAEADDQNRIVTEAAAAATGRFTSDYDTIYDGVVGPWFLPIFTSAAGLAELDYVILLPSVEVCISRVRSRPGHGFTDEAATRKMHEEFSRASAGWPHVVSSDVDNLDETVGLIRAARGAGRLRFHIDGARPDGT